VQASETLRLPGSRETLEQVLGSIQDLIQYQLPDDYYQTYAGKVRALTVADMAQSAAQVVEPERLVWVVIGDRSKIEAGVRELNLGEVRVLNAE
jgi:zinc protease